MPSPAASPNAGVLSMLDRATLLRLILKGSLCTIAVNVAGLVSPVFFTQIFDRVLSTGSIETLVALTVTAIVVIVLGGAIEQVRGVLFTRVGASIYADLERNAYFASHAAAASGESGRRSQPLDDLEAVRAFASGPLPAALLDLVFAPLLVVVLFLVNVWAGVFAILVLAAMIVVSVITQWTISDVFRTSSESSLKASSLAESHMRSAEASVAMGYVSQTHRRWAELSRKSVKAQVDAVARAGGLTSAARSIRASAQTLMIALAALLALRGDVSAGSIIAISIILTRIIAPVDALLGGWRQLAATQIAFARLKALLARPTPEPSVVMLKPSGLLTVDNVTAMSTNRSVVLQGVSFSLEPGDLLGIVGPTGAGKSTLLRCVMGVHPHMFGDVRLGGLPLSGVDREQVGAWLGFLPQNADLEPGTIAENIARFGKGSPAEVFAAAQAAGADRIISGLPNGYDTQVGETGAMLSAGQRRRISLARAMFGEPSLLCLDEPEAHLDRDGEIALAQALRRLKARGATVLIAAHKPSAVMHADKILVLQGGRVVRFGKTADILPSLSQADTQKVPA
jgi:ATP-binding cassette, subfamily C, bacterial exporter for protease/lipase